MLNNKSKSKYVELAKAKITDSRDVVISSCSKGGFTIAQKMKVKEKDKSIDVFFRGAIHIEDVKGLYNLRDAINLSIKKQNDKIMENARWD